MSRRLAALAGLLLGAVLLPQAATAQAPQKPPAPAAKPGPAPANPGSPSTQLPAAPQAPATPGPAAPSPAVPKQELSASHVGLAREVMLNSGIARSFDSIVPAFSEQIKKSAVTRPELTGDLDDVLKGLQPEMEMQKQRMLDIAARIYAQRLDEAQLRDIVAFFRSPAGKRYVETQPQVLDELVGAMQDWTQDVSEYMMVRVRAEMGKRGHQLQ